MSNRREVRVPDLGDFDRVDVVEVLVAAGDEVRAEQGLITLESDKASMEVPSPVAGTVREVRVAVGDKVEAGDVIALLEVTAEVEAEAVTTGAEDAEATAEKPHTERRDRPAAGRRSAPPEADLRTQLLVLGSGPGGYAAAFRAADLGLEVTLVERHPTLGGVCLNVGCIPSKALLHAARVVEEAAFFAANGLGFGAPQLDLDKLRGWKEGVVGRLTGGLAGLAKRRKVRLVQGTGTLTSPHTLEIDGPEGRRTLAFEQAILAAGSRPVQLPGLPYDDPRLMDSTAALALADVPRRLLVIGGGIIGLEMATVYHALGSRVSVVELTDGLIPEADRALVRHLQKRLEAAYEAIYLGTRVTAITPEADGLKVSFDGADAPGSDLFDRVLLAVGRRPNGDRIGAEAAGLTVDERGFVPVDRQLRTAVGHLFAIGDLARPPLLAHKASHEGKVAAEVAAGGKSSFDARAIPAVAYTDPEIAWVGLTEKEAEEGGVAYDKGTFPWSASGRALTLGRADGLTQLLFDPATKRLLGAGIVGPNAGDLIAEAALAVEMGCEAADLASTIHPHPTLSETLAFAAEVCEGTVTELYVQRRGKK